MAARPQIVRGEAARKSAAELERFAKDDDWFWENLSRLKKEHPKQWVAVYQLRVVGADKNFEKLLASLRQLGLDPAHCLIEATDIDEFRFRLVRSPCDSAAR